MDRIELELYLNNLLEIGRFKDYCPNGLQVEGTRRVQKIATGVTASLAFLEAALEWGADTVLVHHGYFWRNEAPQITGRKHRRLHADRQRHQSFRVSPAARRAPRTRQQRADRCAARRHCRRPFRRSGHRLASADHHAAFARALHRDRRERARPQAARVRRCRPRVAARRVVHGRRAGYFEQAIDAGADVYLSGEVSEQTMHIAAESGVAYIAAGHHATERYGVQAVGAHLSEEFDIEHVFIDIDNPV